MDYILVFIEGILAFLSPCILPMLPIYLVYLSGQDNSNKLIKNTLGFILGFTIIFMFLGAVASAIGAFLQNNRVLLQRISGIIVILIGLSYLDIIKINFSLNKSQNIKTTNLNFFSSILFGCTFAISWSACLGSFLGTATMLAANKTTVYQGMFMLFLFSLGLSIPFFVTAIIYDKIKFAFDFIKKNYGVVKIISGIILIITGLALLLGLFNYWLAVFNL